MTRFFVLPAAVCAACALSLPAAGRPAQPLLPPIVPAHVQSVDSLSDALDSLGVDSVDEAIERGLDALEDNPSLERELRGIATSLGVDYDGVVNALTRSTRASTTSTRFLSRAVEESGDECGKLPNRYRVDCIQQSYEALRNILPRRGDYAAARRALSTVSLELDRIKRRSRDRSQPRLRLAGTRGRGFQAVRDNAAVQQAVAVIEQARQQLLRSVAQSDPRYRHYVRIAQAFENTAVLLRS